MAKRKFKVSAELKNIIGRDLITDDFVAIFELVKNSFDAHATRVDLVFNFDEKSVPCLYVIDNGKGMSVSDIEHKWLFLAYSAKKEGEEDPRLPNVKNHYAGNKGVGRFSCDRLGRMLTIETRSTKDGPVNVLDVAWGAFENRAKTEFQDVEVDLTHRTGFSRVKNFTAQLKTGTVLKISDLRDSDSWTRNKLRELKKSLMKLIDPLGGVVSNRKIVISCPREQARDDEILRNGEAGENILDVINGEVDNRVFGELMAKSTSIDAKLIREELVVSLFDRDRCIYKTTESIADRFPYLVGCDLAIQFGYLNRAAKMHFTKRMGMMPVQYGSLFLSLNGFRIFPVGDEGDDFWGLEHRKQQGYSRYLGTREIFGCVRLVSDDGESFKESSSRDKGLILTSAVEDLKELVLHCTRKLEAYVTTILWPDKFEQEELTTKGLLSERNRAKIISFIRKISQAKGVAVVDYDRDIVSIINEKGVTNNVWLDDLREIAEKHQDRKLLGRIAEVEKRLADVVKKQQEAAKIAQQEQDARMRSEQARAKSEHARKAVERDLEEEKKRSLFLTSINSVDKDALECFLHQIGIDANSAKVDLENALISNRELLKSKPDFLEKLSRVMMCLESVNSLARFATRANFRLNAREITADIAKFIKEHVEQISRIYAARITLAVEGTVQESVRKFNPMEIAIVLDNLISNAKKARANRIVFKFSEDANFLRIAACDNGRGLDPALSATDYEQLFSKGFSRTDGSGLGLYFCKLFVEKLGGRISVQPDKSGHGTEFLMRIPKK